MKVESSGGKVVSLYQHHTPEEKVEMLFRQYYAGLCKSLYRILRDDSLAEDIVQEVFLKVWEIRDQLKMDEAIQSYLYRSCYNTALNFLKKQKQNTDVAVLEVVPDEDTAEKSLDFAETENQVFAAIEALPPKTRMVFSLSRFEELSYKEIADRLEISIKSVEKHMGIALQRLRENLREYLVGLLLFLLSQLF
ncbi:DNA-directed RNA polymerase sigma-70 factor [Adhaeribacter aerolatus]|uniref:DNA-directed RNA polymerase sigma-70 factor n=1 Tax=Adhaeribacter aerolatus TaxID=670289 RepID=A0A512AX31_9BACT|nr:RNA polymerase sigma-70 factor [Adhaeribacter aerolatus]GEO04273.1 DNA-directed RNA polymerase sigma-70 factor [Adhaeribacter aerolatus]